MPEGADAEPSRWLYSWLSTSRSLLTLFLFGWIKIAWKLTGKPYLVLKILKMHLDWILSKFEKKKKGLVVSPEYRFHKYTKSFDMNPCTKCFAEVHFQPSDKWTLKHSFNHAIIYWFACDNIVKNTYELLLFIGHQFRDFTFTSCQFFFVVSEIANNKFLFTCMQFKFLNHLSH